MALIGERVAHIPVAYLTCNQEFYNRPFYITRDVLIPRGDTEVLVETSLQLLSQVTEKSPHVLDMCTGSGCVGITIALEDSRSLLTLSDISDKALEVVATNIENLGAKHVSPIQSDLFSALEGEKFSLICSNPPYIAPHWYEICSQEVHNEPTLALIDHSSDGLDILRKIIRLSPLHLHKNGYLVVECDYRQIAEVMRLFREQGFSDVTSYKDLGDRQRVVSGRYTCTKS
jgi:release factor glutamine methyltransferase